MRVLAVGQRILGGRCLRVIASSLSVLVLAAVPALGITRLGGDALSSWGARDGGPDGGPLTFDAPASAVAQRQPAPGEADRGPAGARSDRAAVVDLNDWAFTDTRSDVTALIVLEQGQVAFDNQLAGAAVFAITTGRIDPDTASKIIFAELGSQLLTDSFSVNNNDPLQAPTAALFNSEIATDLFLLGQGFSVQFLNQVIFQQLTINSFVQGIFLGGLPAAAPTIPTITIPTVTSPAR
jgi:hypothetical protein